jgi:hypothetical protein
MKEEDIDKLSNAQLIQIIKKYKIGGELKKSINRDEAVSMVKNFLKSKMEKKQNNEKNIIKDQI